MLKNSRLANLTSYATGIMTLGATIAAGKAVTRNIDVPSIYGHLDNGKACLETGNAAVVLGAGLATIAASWKMSHFLGNKFGEAVQARRHPENTLPLYDLSLIHI